jgi:hypothetical protein
MRSLLFIIVFFVRGLLNAQSPDSIIPKQSILDHLNVGDSVIYYQCHVEEAVQQMATVSGQTISGKLQKYSITEKFVVKKTAAGMDVTYYTSSLNVFPNRKFSGLKIREKAYWEFKKVGSYLLSERDLKILLALEKRGREAIEYDYAITKYTTNQLIIKRKKNFKQLVIEGDYVLSKLLGKA